MIYFAEALGLGLVKIGRTYDPHQRLEALVPNCPAPLLLLAAVDEEVLTEPQAHALLAKWRVHGEWFRVSADLWDLLGRLPRVIGVQRKRVPKLKGKLLMRAASVTPEDIVRVANGRVLTQRELAELLGVKREPVRLALTRLEKAGRIKKLVRGYEWVN